MITEKMLTDAYAMNVPNLRRRSQAVYLACDAEVAKDISATMLWAADEIERLRKTLEAMRDDPAVPPWIQTLAGSVIPDPVGAPKQP